MYSELAEALVPPSVNTIMSTNTSVSAAEFKSKASAHGSAPLVSQVSYREVAGSAAEHRELSAMQAKLAEAEARAALNQANWEAAARAAVEHLRGRREAEEQASHARMSSGVAAIFLFGLAVAFAVAAITGTLLMPDRVRSHHAVAYCNDVFRFDKPARAQEWPTPEPASVAAVQALAAADALDAARDNIFQTVWRKTLGGFVAVELPAVVELTPSPAPASAWSYLFGATDNVSPATSEDEL